MENTDGKKITIFTSEQKRFHHRPIYEAIVEELHKAGIADATVTRGIAGFGEDRKVSTIKIEVLSFNLPITIEATDTVGKIDSVAPAIAEILQGGVMEIMPVQLIRKSTDQMERAN
jgi:PII-like signaling protein